MKTIRNLTLCAALLATLASCGAPEIPDGVVSNNKAVLTLFYVSKTKSSPDAREIPNCTGEYLVKVEKRTSKKPTLSETMASLFNSELMGDAGAYTSDLIKNKQLAVDEADDSSVTVNVSTDQSEAKQDTQSSVQLKLKTSSGASMKDLCDASRAHAQITETVREYSGTRSFQTTLDGEIKNWECLGNTSASCKK